MSTIQTDTLAEESNGTTSDLTNSELVELLQRYTEELETVRNERANALRAFGDSQKQLVSTQVRAEIGTWERWAGSDRVFLSDQSFRMLGYEPGELESNLTVLKEIIHPDDRVRVLRSLREAETSSHGDVIYFRICRKDGESRRIRCEFVVTDDAEGNPWKMSGVIQDLTELELPINSDVSELDVAIAAEFCPFFIVYCDLEGTLKYINRTMIEDFPSMKVGRSIFDFTTNSTTQVRAAMERIKATSQPCEFSFDSVSQAGENRSFSAWIGPVVRHNKIEGFVLTVLGRNDSREVMRSGLSEKYEIQPGTTFRTQRKLNFGYWAKNYDTGTALWSPEKFRILGLDFNPALATRETLAKLVVKEDLARLERAVIKASDSGEGFALEYRIIRPDGNERIIYSTGEIVYNHWGEKLLVGTLQDITDRKSLSTSLRDAELKYSALFQEMSRTHADMLQISRKLSTIQEEERRRLSLELHDDVGGLLSGIQILLHLHNDQGENVEPRLIKISELVDDIIDRVDKMTRKLRPSSLDRLGLKSTLLSHFSEYEYMFKVDLGVSVFIPDESLISEDVKIAAYRIIQEALTNMARHSGVKKGSVKVEQSSNRLDIQIRDAGIGINDHLAGPTSPGIGIDGRKERALLLGGTLDIISSPGNGTIVNASFPI
ncbi:MAG: PAS domain S-box protein [Bacteroidetes bacterium]|nr:MAG: PAS domain S-box protein [Bacteroidota bacterium]